MWLSRLLIVCSLVLGYPAGAHEFWIEPTEFQVENGETVVGSLKNGQEFEGISLGYFDDRFTRFDATLGNEQRVVPGRLGDSPALNIQTWDDGLLIIAHETTPSSLTYTEWEKFLAFAEHKDFPNAAKDHVANGWSKEKFRESYTRHAKALIAVGNGDGADRALGLETEIVALTNPYADGFDNEMLVRVDYNGAPRPDAQLEVFEKIGEQAAVITLYRTDDNGVATIPVKPGHSYLFDAVVLRPSAKAGSAENAPVWETLWAALTFAVP